MMMNYLTAVAPKGETLIAVAADEDHAAIILKDLTAAHPKGSMFHIRTLNQLFDNKVEIPPALKWIVESDRKHQQREIEGRTKGLVDENAMSFRPGGCSLGR